MKKGITFGVFDIFHIGHLNMIERAKEQCDHLIVAVHNDLENIKGVEFFYSLDDRMRMVASINHVDEVIVYERVDEAIKNVDVDVFCHGPDQCHDKFENAKLYCRENGISVMKLERTEGVSSTDLRSFLKDKKKTTLG